MELGCPNANAFKVKGLSGIALRVINLVLYLLIIWISGWGVMFTKARPAQETQTLRSDQSVIWNFLPPRITTH